MAVLTVQELGGSTGTSVTTASADAGGDSFANDGATFFEVNNGSGSPVTVTLVTQQVTDGDLAVADRTAAIPAGERYIFGALRTGIYNDGSNLVQVTYSAVTTVTVAAWK